MQYLYDIDYEIDKVTLIQSVLMMSWWYADTEDRIGPCYWVGVAIGLCHTVGLHRAPVGSASAERTFSNTQKRLWRRIWWSCVAREVWHTLTFGRPMRICLDDCDTPLPAPGDAWERVDSLPDSTRAKYLPEGQHILSELHISMLKLTISCAKILRRHYGPKNLSMSTMAIDLDEQEILQHQTACRMRTDYPSKYAQAHAAYLGIHYE